MCGNCDKTTVKYEYTGVEDCEMMAFIPGSGAKNCTFGCMGFGSCVKACPFDAIHIVNGIAVVDQEACKACGKCVAKCPRHLIELVPYDKQTRVACSSHAKGKAVTAACELGCIGCKNVKRIVRPRRSQLPISVHTLIMISVQAAVNVRKFAQDM